MDFDSKIIILRMCLGDKGSGLAHARADLQEPGRPPAKEIIEVQHVAGEWNAIFGHQRMIGTTLGV
jgi:hypothetical protein